MATLTNQTSTANAIREAQNGTLEDLDKNLSAGKFSHSLSKSSYRHIPACAV
jgi:hypothetical protein